MKNSLALMEPIYTQRTQLGLNKLRGGKGQLIFNSEMSRVIHAEAERRMSVSLSKNVSVVYDGFLNTPERREQVSKIGTLSGAAVLSLCIETEWATIEGSLRNRHEAETLPAIANELILDHGLDSYLQRIQKMHDYVQWPSRSEPLDVLFLDGTQSTAQLLAQVATHLCALQTGERELPFTLVEIKAGKYDR